LPGSQDPRFPPLGERHGTAGGPGALYYSMDSYSSLDASTRNQELLVLKSMYPDELLVVPNAGEQSPVLDDDEEIPAVIRDHSAEISASGSGEARSLRLRLAPRRDGVEPCFVEVDLWVSMGPSYPMEKEALRLCVRPVRGLEDTVSVAPQRGIRSRCVAMSRTRISAYDQCTELFGCTLHDLQVVAELEKELHALVEKLAEEQREIVFDLAQAAVRPATTAVHRAHGPLRRMLLNR
jgi:hypothetical protein